MPVIINANTMPNFGEMPEDIPEAVPEVHPESDTHEPKMPPPIAEIGVDDFLEGNEKLDRKRDDGKDKPTIH